MLPEVAELAQIGGRNRLGWPDRFRLDLDDVRRQSLGLDLWILWRTLVRLADTSSTLPGKSDEPEEFWGSAGRLRETATLTQSMEQRQRFRCDSKLRIDELAAAGR